jgi:hypothetical protein
MLLSKIATVLLGAEGDHHILQCHSALVPAEALCNVALPRSDGTCTRCPTEVRMTATGGSWGARVSVRVEWDDATASRLPAPQEVLIQVGVGVSSQPVCGQLTGVFSYVSHI